MGIKRREKCKAIKIPLEGVLKWEPPLNEDGTPKLTRKGRAPEDPWVEERAILGEHDAVLTVRRVSGQRTDEWSRELNKTQVEMARLDRQAQSESGDPNTEAPESAQLLLTCYKRFFEECFIDLAGFEDVDGASDAWEAIYDFLPLLAMMVGAAILGRQRPTRPES